ncbi:Hydrocephalus-inducing protein [Wickerhamomyces ciferrii]|uniref:Hydrocephalus-inducing protein n=1 Tax=Wickerhamomyces ciferrii (strain ATCC 14091 / BCRC 22168 / CBS 111 / JCM 3599 / NBRC 0793 / NRRL Y-1031 F-60-10) TaxID=1206466 RepID=K0KXK4_WICCF|nr:Hydrocephalus-inducing protein [Wickerhamomyces ciferrii]CCH45768.1 Hydrocephalus-inducing protein [Wickerhamomyces ciferrii]
MSSSLEERLKNNSSAFDGLLSLIPAKYYYDDDTQNQWKAKKQSKEEAKEAKRAKLDPSQFESNEKSASASEVLKKRAANAKPVVLPGLKQKPVQESESEDENDSDEDEQDESNDDDSDDHQIPEPKSIKQQNGKQSNEKQQETKSKSQKNNNKEDESNDEEEDINIVFDDEGNEIELHKEQERKLQKEQQQQKQQQAQGKKPLTEEEKLKKEESLKALKEKLSSKINILKEKRKALGSKAAGAPSSREAILEERRKKAEAKAEARALQKKRKAEELDDESGSGSDSGSDAESDVEDDGMSANGVLYQNIRFNDDERTTSDLSKLRKQSKKGPAKKDLKAHLKLLEAKKQKLSQLEDSKQKELNEKEKWNSVIAQAEGEKLRNDEKLLKKALKRKEALKRKSEYEWKERKQTVQDSISAKQKRREENLQIRKDNKGIKRKNQSKQKRKFKGAIVPKRAGFEGRRSRK